MRYEIWRILKQAKLSAFFSVSSAPEESGGEEPEDQDDHNTSAQSSELAESANDLYHPAVDGEQRFSTRQVKAVKAQVSWFLQELVS